eukprot:scaffold16639_cov28-Tisochrysis_lutea.AAC.1
MKIRMVSYLCKSLQPSASELTCGLNVHAFDSSSAFSVRAAWRAASRRTRLASACACRRAPACSAENSLSEPSSDSEKGRGDGLPPGVSGVPATPGRSTSAREAGERGIARCPPPIGARGLLAEQVAGVPALSGLAGPLPSPASAAGTHGGRRSPG